MAQATIKDLTLDAVVMRERVRLLFEHLPFVLGGSLSTATFMAVLLWNSAPHPLLTTWTLTIWLISALRWFLRKRFLGLTANYDAMRWAHAYALLAGLAGCAWGTAGIFLFQQDSLVLVTLVIVFAGMAAGSVASHASYLPAYIAFVVPTIAPFALRCIAQFELFYVVIGVLCLVYLLVNINYGINIGRALVESIRLRFINIALTREQTHLREIADAARAKAEQASAAKTRFFAAVSHDLRQPAQALAFYADALAHDAQAPSLLPLINNIRATGDSLQNLLDALLDVSRIEADTIQPSVCDFPIGVLLARITRDFDYQASDKDLQLRLAPTSVWVHSDPLQLERILRNFISNAIKYTPQGAVLIGCRRAGTALRIEVHDTGIGIAPALQSSVFREFHQLDNPERDRNKGLGLGLSIAHGLARLLDLPLTLRSTPGRGSVFAITVPLGKPSPIAALTPLHAPDDITGKSVLLIDDDPLVRDAATAIMERFGCVVVVAESANEALDLMRDSGFAPDVILADYRLRDRATGVDAIHAINAYCGRLVPAGVLTGDTAPDRLREVRATGFPLAHKPLSGAKLRALLSSLLILVEQKCD